MSARTTEAVVLAVGTGILWTFNRLAHVVLSAVPGLGRAVAEWLALNPPTTALAALAVSGLFALGIRVVDRDRSAGIQPVIMLAVLVAVVTLDTNAHSGEEVGSHVVSALAATMRGLGIVMGAGAMRLARRVLERSTGLVVAATEKD